MKTPVSFVAILLLQNLSLSWSFTIPSPPTRSVSNSDDALLSRKSTARIVASQRCMSSTDEDAAVSFDGSEKAWRYAKKPLLSIGAKGATAAHGNSLRQLLEDHTIVKVKVNPKPFDNNLENAFTKLRELAEEKGAPKNIEMIQARDSARTILFGMPGTMDRIQSGDFPPEEPEPEVEEGEEE